MRSTWRLPQERFLPIRTWTERNVLLEFNGPQLAVVACDDALYLSVATDDSDDKVRWLRSRISKVELQALLLGAVSVRDCILKSEIVVVDTDRSGIPLMEAVVSPDLLQECDLPSIHSKLPDEMIAANRQNVDRPVFVLNGLSIVEHTVGFRVLADLSLQVQRLWNAIGQAILSNATAKGSVPAEVLSQTELRLASLQPGSIGLQVGVPNERVFSEIATSYRRLVGESFDLDSAQTLLHPLKARVRSVFSDYLEVVQRHGVDVLTRWGDEAAFVSPSTANRISSYLGYVGGEEEERFTVTGHFVGFNIRGASFEFEGLADETRYEGQVSPRVLSNPALRIVVGRAAIYEATIVVYSWSVVGGASKQHMSLESVTPNTVPLEQ